MSTFHLRVVAYDKVFYDGEAESVFVQALDGVYQLLARHESCVIAVVPGELRIVDGTGKNIYAACSNGMLSFDAQANECRILADTIERPEDIDIVRAQEAKVKAEEKLRQQQSKIEYYQSQASLSRAMARLKEASKHAK